MTLCASVKKFVRENKKIVVFISIPSNFFKMPKANKKMAPSGSGRGGNTNSSSSRFTASKHFVFTWNNYLAPMAPKILFEKLGAFFIYQEETGLSGTRHLQGYVCFKNKTRPTELKEMKGVHWEKCRDIEAAKKYCCKEETRTGQIFHNIPLPKDKKPIRMLEFANFYEWQKDVWTIANSEPDDRTIHWFYEEDGNHGKSALVKRMVATIPDCVLVGGKGADMKNGIVNYMLDGNDYPAVVLIDIPRSVDTKYVSYQGIEEVKNGCFFSTKYESRMVIGNSPTVIVFANYPPPEEKLSADRWNIKKIELTKQYVIIEVDEETGELVEIYNEDDQVGHEQSLTEDEDIGPLFELLEVSRPSGAGSLRSLA